MMTMPAPADLPTLVNALVHLVKAIAAADDLTRAQFKPILDQFDALVRLRKETAATDDLTRAQIKPIFDQLFKAPEQAAALGRRLEATLALSRQGGH